MSFWRGLVGGVAGAGAVLGIAALASTPIGWAVGGIALSAGMGGWGIGNGVDQKVDADERNKKMEDLNNAAMKRQEAKAEVLARKQYTKAAQQFAAATVSTKKDLLDSERERAADNRNYGNPAA